MFNKFVSDNHLRQKAERVKGHGAEHVSNNSRRFAKMGMFVTFSFYLSHHHFSSLRRDG